jgi:hypothetical protein
MMGSGVFTIPYTDTIARAAVERREQVMRVYLRSWPDAESPGRGETDKEATGYYEGTTSLGGGNGCDMVEATAGWAGRRAGVVDGIS